MMPSPLSETPADPPDEELVSLAQGGDRRALEQLVARHGPWIFNVAARMVWRRNDVTQEVLVKVITRLSTFCGERAFRTWLYPWSVERSRSAAAAILRIGGPVTTPVVKSVA